MNKLITILLLFICTYENACANNNYNENTIIESNYSKQQGDSAYLNKDYTLAIQIYENILKEGEAAEIYYNLGNSYYKSNLIGKAILNYERALLLQPGNGDIRANLEIAQAKTIDKITIIPEIFFISWAKTLINCISIDAWAKWGIVTFILFLAAISLYLFSNKLNIRKIGFALSVTFILISVFSNIFASIQKDRFTQRNHAIIVSPSVIVRSTPNENGVSLFVIHEGLKVEIKDNSMNSWKEIRLTDGKVGWIPINSIEII